MMTKKYYKKVASIFAKYKDIYITTPKDIYITAMNEEGNEDILPLSVIIEDNPLFNKTKFKKAIYGRKKI